MDETITQGDSILSDIEPASEEQQDNDKSESQDDIKGFNKFAMKTNNKLNKYDQSLKDITKFSSYQARGFTPQEIMDRDPEFAKRLSQNEEFADLFVSDEPETEEDRLEKLVEAKLGATQLEQRKNDAINSLMVQGKRLSSTDRKILKENPKFQKRFNALIKGGFDPSEAAEESFGYAFPKFQSKVSGSVLSSRSEPVEEKSEVKLTKKDQSFVDSFRKTTSRDKKRAKR